MSLLGTLAKVAMGVAVAKGMASITQKGSAGSGSVFGGARSPGARQTTTRSSGGIEDLLGSVLSGRGAQSGGLGGLMDGLAKASRTPDAQVSVPQTGGFGDLLNQSFDRFGEPEVAPNRAQEDQAALMLKAMLQAAKSDGKIDAAEKEKLLGQLGDISPEEKSFINQELSAPVDVQALTRAVPRGMESQVYLMSVMGIDLDNRNEANYLHELATALGIDQQSVNHIHAQLGAPALYR